MLIEKMIKSNDGMATKFVQSAEDGMHLETTYVDYYNKHIICFATQIGCSYGCTFCANGLAHNFKRNLSAPEIVAQCLTVMGEVGIQNGRDLQKPILFSAMGCGDPLANSEELLTAFHILHLMYKDAKFSMATTGVPLLNLPTLMNGVDAMELDFKLMVSLHAGDNKVRRMLLPRSGDLGDLMDAMKSYQQSTIPHHVDYNVVLFDGINDSKWDAEKICRLLESRKLVELSTIKINNYNPVPNSTFRESQRKEEFVRILELLGANVEVYETNGSDIGAACGQLTAY